ncbi:MAG: glycosyltransferase family 39 protein [Anaerolineae bacterium]|nr:glycosyltransferase family 39 protein [Anaerolineae bacterium]
MKNRWQNLALGALILLAFALRVYRLDAQDIWGDEAFSIFLSQQPLNVVVAGASDTHPPFYPFLLWVWLQLVGSSALATRALSALIGTLVAPLIFVLAKRVTASPRVVWFAALFATISPLLIYYSQETRMYELVAILALASTYFAARVIETKHARLDVAYWLVSALAIYTHYSAFFVLAAQNLFALVMLRRDRAALARWFALQTALVLAYVPWIWVQTAFLQGKASARFDEWGWSGIELIFGKTFLAFSIGLTVEAPLAQFATTLFLTVAGIGIFALVRARRAIGMLVPLYFSVPIVIAYLVNPIMPFFFERYVLVALPGFILLVACGLDLLMRYNARLTLGIIGVLILFDAFALGEYFYNDAYAKGKYGKMMAYITAHAQPGDALVLNNPLQKPLYRYYAPRDLPAYFLPDGGAAMEDPAMRAQLEEIARRYARVWLVMFGNPAEYDPTGYLERWLGTHAYKSFARGFVDAALSLYVMPNASPLIRYERRAMLGDSIELLGYAFDRVEAAPGEIVLLTLRWQTSAPIRTRYTVFAHVIGGVNPATQTPVWAQMDSEPAGGARPTTDWRVGQVIEDRRGLWLPEHTPPGEYLIEVGMYDAATLARLPVFIEGKRVEEDRVILGTLRVKR